MHVMMYDIIVRLENFRFRSSARKRSAVVFKIVHAGDRFRKPAFLVPENAADVRGTRHEAKTEKKNLSFQKYPDTCGRGRRAGK